MPSFTDPLHRPCNSPVTWSRVNLMEAMPGVLTPMGWTFWHLPVERATRRAFYDLGAFPRSRLLPDPPTDQRITNIFYGRPAGSVDIFREVAAAMPGSSPRVVDLQIFGTVRDDVDNSPNLRRYPVAALKVPVVFKRSGARLAKARATAAGFWSEATAAPPATVDAARALLAASQNLFQAVLVPTTLVGMIATGVFDQLTQLAAAAGLEGLETSLATGLGDFPEMALAADLWDVSRGRSDLAAFLAQHGYHGPGEGELSSYSWREERAPLAQVLDAYRRMDDAEDPRNLHRRQVDIRRASEARLRSALGPTQRARGEVLLAARRFLCLREIAKGTFLQVFDAGRLATRSLGRALAGKGLVDDPNDAFYLTVDEVRAGLPDDLREIVRFRRDQRASYEKLDLPDFWTGMPQVQAPQPVDRTGDVVVSGLPVAPGVVEGVVRLVLDPAECSVPLEPGEILVCRTTDPSWVSMFLTAAALVIDIGGPISHGAIVARELGIPCVINTRTGSSQLANGDRVRVDGNSGKIVVLARATCPEIGTTGRPKGS